MVLVADGAGEDLGIQLISIKGSNKTIPSKNPTSLLLKGQNQDCVFIS
jgi:hypothetical protein